MVLYIDIWREFFGGVPTSTTILDGNRDITRGKCLDFSVFFYLLLSHVSGKNSFRLCIWSELITNEDRL